jgi:hypothetical protein
MLEAEYRYVLPSRIAVAFQEGGSSEEVKAMPTLDIHAVGNTLLGGFAVILAVLWVFVHLSAVRDLHKSSLGKL